MRHRRKLGRRKDYQFGNLYGLVESARSDGPRCVGSCGGLGRDGNDPTHRLDRPSDDIERHFCDECLEDLQERGVFPEATVEKIDYE